MNCQEALDLLYDIVDKQASEIDISEVRAHLENCRDCFEIYRVEEAIHEFITLKIRQSHSSQQLDHLKSKIMSSLDEVDLGNRSEGPARFFGLSTKVLAVAASLVLVIGAAVILYSFDSHYSDYIPLEQSHCSAEENPAVFASAEQTGSILTTAENRYGYDIAEDVVGLHLVGGSTETIMDVEMMHLVYAAGERIVSVFVAPSDLFSIPSDLQNSPIRRGDLIFFGHNCRGCRLVFHQVGSAIIITATRSPQVELLEFVPGSQII